MRSRREIVFGIVTLLAAAIYYSLVVDLPTSQLDDTVGPQGLPRLYAGALAGLSVLWIGGAWWRGWSAGSDDADPHPRTRWTWRATGLFATGLAYLTLISSAGYVLSLGGLIAATAYLQGARPTRTLGVIALLGAVAFWILFVWLLRVPHPPGRWSTLFE